MEVNNINDSLDLTVSDNIRQRSKFFITAVNDLFKEGEIKDPIERYGIYADKLCEYAQRLELEGVDTNSRSSIGDAIVATILTGSLLEATIVFFLKAYIDDYCKDSKYHWKLTNGADVDIAGIKDKLFACLTELQNDNKITAKQRNSIKKVIAEKLKPHEEWKEVHRFTLEDLIEFCNINKIFADKKQEDTETNDKPTTTMEKVEIIGDASNPLFVSLNESIDAMTNQIYDETYFMCEETILATMKEIQKARNNIHVFTGSATVTVDESLKSISLLCRVIHDLGYRIYMKANHDKIIS